MPRKITRDDFMKIRLLSDPQLSPDGAQIACVVRRTDAEKSKYRSDLWLVPTEGGEARQFTGGDWSDGSPRWSPDGRRIAFLSDRQKPKSQIFVIPADGGEATPLTQLDTEGGIQNIRWSPDGSQIAFLFRAVPEAHRKEAVEKRQKDELPSPPRVHRKLFYRLDGFGFRDDAFWQVWTADAQTGECRALTEGDYDCSDPVWSPDGRTLAFLSDRREDGDRLPAHEDIWTVPATVSKEGGEMRRVPSPPGPKSALAWSPDGTTLAYAGNPDPEDAWGTNNARLYLLPVAGGETARDLTGHADLAVGYLTLSDSHDAGAGDLIQWNASGEALFFAASAFGDVRLYLADANGNGLFPLSPPGHEMGGFSIAPNGRAAVTLGSPTQPHEIAVLYEPHGGESGVRVETRTQFNREWLADVEILAPEPLSLDNGEGGEVPGWLLKPRDLGPGQKAPLVVYVHGGPHAQYGNVFFHELQWLAAEGYAVLYLNPRGSKGYGEAHTKAIAGDWGGADFRDIMAATDYACGLDCVDASRAAIMGGSYGGFMTAWAIGHTDRFACAIADRLVANLHSMSGTCDFPWRSGSYFKGDAWNDPSDLWRCSPLAHAGRITTPLLLIHSDGDLRCDIGQAEELFAALRLQGKTVEFVRYPAETSHGMSRNGPPTLRLDRLQRNLDWLNRYLKGIRH